MESKPSFFTCTKASCLPVSTLLVATAVASEVTLSTEALAATLSTEAATLATVLGANAGATLDVDGASLLLVLVEVLVEGHLVTLDRLRAAAVVDVDKDVAVGGLNEAEALHVVKKLNGARHSHFVWWLFFDMNQK